MMGYTEATIARKAALRGMEPHEYELYLIQKRSERPARRKASREAKAEAQQQAQKAEKSKKARPSS